jgi:hypothetical protein
MWLDPAVVNRHSWYNDDGLLNEILKKAGLKGFEPLAYGLRVRRSSGLSYRPVTRLI